MPTQFPEASNNPSLFAEIDNTAIELHIALITTKYSISIMAMLREQQSK